MRTRYIIYTVLQAFFCAVVPVVFIFLQYGSSDGGLKYKIPLGAILAILLVLFAANAAVIRPRRQRLAAKIAQHESDLAIESDSNKIDNLIDELKVERTVETIINAIVPLLVFVALYIGAKGLERSAFLLSGALGFSLLSFALGTIFGVLSARSVWAKHDSRRVKK